MSENPFSAFTPKKEWLVCVDSDGCAMDTMDSKHHQAFCPQLIRVYGLEEYAGLITPHWMEVNLYSRTRGVVSSANSEALAEEWTRHGLVQHMDVVLGQDAGTKEACLSALSAKGYAPGHVLMVGDALGDLAAAQHADALFYPILVGKEKTSWERLVSEALPRFLAGTFAGAYQEQLLAEQREILK